MKYMEEYNDIRRGLTCNDKDTEGYLQVYEPLSKLLVSPLITPVVIPYVIPYISPL